MPPPPPPPPPEKKQGPSWVHAKPSHWSHEISTSKIVGHNIWPKLMARLKFSPLLLFIILIRWGCPSMLFQWQIENASLVSRWLGTSFHKQRGPWNKSTRKHVMFQWRLGANFGQSKIVHLFKIMNLKTYHPPKHVKFQRAAQHAF